MSQDFYLTSILLLLLFFLALMKQAAMLWALLFWEFIFYELRETFSQQLEKSEGLNSTVCKILNFSRVYWPKYRDGPSNSVLKRLTLLPLPCLQAVRNTGQTLNYTQLSHDRRDTCPRHWAHWYCIKSLTFGEISCVIKEN